MPSIKLISTLTLILVMMLSSMTGAAPTGQPGDVSTDQTASSSSSISEVGFLPFRISHRTWLTDTQTTIDTFSSGEDITTTTGQDGVSFITAMRTANMPKDPDGIYHIADDGVARSYAGNGTVLGYVKLNNKQLIEAAWDKNKDVHAHLLAVW